MSLLVCEHCKAEVELPDTYDAPYVRCNVCGTHLKTGRGESGKGAKFNLKPSKRPAVSQSVAPVFQPEQVEQNSAVVVAQSNASPNKTPSTGLPYVKQESVISKSAEKEKRIREAMGEEGMKKAVELVSDYVCMTSPKARTAGRARAVQRLMREKYPISIAASAIEYAERSPEALTLAKAKNLKKSVIIAGVASLLIAGLLAFL